jgi:hypothetical protein
MATHSKHDLRLSALTASCIIASALVARADSSKTEVITVQPGKNTDVYLEINLSGKVYLAIQAPVGGEACANFWWIKWPFGNIQDLGRHCGNAAFDIPGLSSFAFSAKLRVGGAKQLVKVVAGASEEVAHSATVHFP